MLLESEIPSVVERMRLRDVFIRFLAVFLRCESGGLFQHLRS